MTTNFIAALATEDGTVDTDIRTLTDEQLRSLQVEAGAAGDSELVATINELLGTVDRYDRPSYGAFIDGIKAVRDSFASYGAIDPDLAFAALERGDLDGLDYDFERIDDPSSTEAWVSRAILNDGPWWVQS